MSVYCKGPLRGLQFYYFEIRNESVFRNYHISLFFLLSEHSIDDCSHSNVDYSIAKKNKFQERQQLWQLSIVTFHLTRLRSATGLLGDSFSVCVHLL